MKTFNWDPEKNEWLKTRRGVSFEEIVDAIRAGALLATRQNPSTLHPGQRVFIVRFDSYVWSVPFVESETEVFLKTAFPDRDFNKEYADEN